MLHADNLSESENSVRFALYDLSARHSTVFEEIVSDDDNIDNRQPRVKSLSLPIEQPKQF